MGVNATALEFRIHGMDCAEEVTALKAELGPVVGDPDRLMFDILNGKMSIRGGAKILEPDTVIAAVARTGMTAELWVEELSRTREESFWERHGRTVLTAVSGIATGLGFLTHAFLAKSWAAALGHEGLDSGDGVPWAAGVAYLIGVIAGAWFVLPRAWIAARNRRPDMNLLMTIAVVGAIAIGELFEASTVSFLFSLSLALEAWSIDRARRAIGALLELSPPTAWVLSKDGEKEVPASQITPGTRIAVRPGDRIPLDGRVLSGESNVNQASITGESMPVTRRTGDDVFAGTINGDGALVVEVTKASSDTVLSQIIRMVGEAQSKRAQSEQWVDRFAQIYTPAVMMLAVLVLLIPPLVFGQSWSEWIYRALVLLVVACPCALVISTPVSIVAALAAAARHGVLVKGGKHLETPAQLTAVAVDKTGTLTVGRPRVLTIVPMHGHTEEEVLRVVGSLESASNHPIARAIVEHVTQRGIVIQPASDFQSLQGKGAQGVVEGRRYWVGAHRYLEERGQESPDVHEKLEEMTDAGKTVVVLGNDEHVCALMGLADTVRPEAKEAVAALHRLGARVVMLTGDNRGTAEAIARETGVDEVYAELLPADKVNRVEELVRRYGMVAMIGDGVNDAPAMARAGLGIAMGAVGSDAAIETADIALMSDDLSRIPWLVEHSRRTMRIVRQNIAVSLAVKGVFVVLTFTGTAALWAAIGADMGATLAVIANGLRLLR